MGDDLRRQIYLNFSHCQTEELVEISRTHDSDAWSETTFDVIREILQERQVDPSPPGQPASETPPKPRKSKLAKMQGVRQAQPVLPRPQKEPTQPADRWPAEPVRPQAVIYAVYLATGGLAIQATLGVVNLVIGQFGAWDAGPLFIAVVGLAALGLLVLEAVLVYGAWLGGNRPRILYIGLTLFAFVSSLMNGGWTAGWSGQPLRTSLYILAACLELVAVTLLVLPASNAWFRQVRPARPAVEQQSKKRRPQSRRSPTWLLVLSPDRWVRRYTFGTLAISFALSLFASWLVYNLGLWLLKPAYQPLDFLLFPNAMYALACLPVQFIALLLGALVGAKRASIPEAKWQQATYGVWTAGLMMILLAILGAGVLPKSGS